MKIYCVFSLESPYRGDSNEYTQNTISQCKKEIYLILSQICNYGICSKGPTNEFETAVVNEPSVFEPLKFDCNSLFYKGFHCGTRGGRVVRWCWVNFQCRGVLLIWSRVGQGPTVLAVGAGGGCLDIFSLVYHFSFLSPSLWETARYRLKYCLKGPLSPKQPTNQNHCGTTYALSHKCKFLFLSFQIPSMDNRCSYLTSHH